MSFQEGLLGLVVKRLGVGGARVAEAQVEEMHARGHPGEHDVGLAPGDLGLHSGMVDLGDERPPRLAELTPAGVHVAANGPLADLGSVLFDKALVDASGGVALLARRLAVGDEPLVDQCSEGPERRSWAALGALSLGRQRRVKRLAHGAPMHAVAFGERPDRQPLVVMVASYLLEQLHPRSHAVLRQLKIEDESSHIRYALVQFGRRDRTDEREGWDDIHAVRRWLIGEYPDLEHWRPPAKWVDVVKRDRQRERFDRTKLEKSVGYASKGRNERAEVRRLASEVAADVERSLGDQPLVTTGQIAAEIMDSLRRRDSIAYLRYASSIKGFSAPKDYEAEALALRKRWL